MQKFTSLVAAASLVLAASAMAQNNEPKKATQPPAKQPAVKPADDKAVKLAVGDKAPAVSVEKWLKGEPVTGFEKGKVYVVEFWATWCGPCKASMPHLSELQKKYKDKGVTFIGTNIWEDKSYSASTLTKVEKFVKDQGDKMSYTVAYDGAAKAMDKNYMQAAGRNGIPSAFLVNGEGNIAWIGHPGEIESAIEKLVGNTDKAKDKKKKDKDAEAAHGSGG